MLVMLLTFAVVFAGCDPDGGYTLVAVTDITGGPATAAVGMPLTLAGTVAPANATNKTIVWSVKDAGTTGAAITGSSLTATAAGTAIVTATIVTATIANGAAEGTPFTKDSAITVEPFVAVRNFWGNQVVAEVGEPLTLNDDKHGVMPDNATDKTITWNVKNAGSTGATITENILTATAVGDATVTGTVANGLAVGMPFTADKTIRVKGPLVAHGDFVLRDILGGIELAQYLGHEANVVVPGDLGITVLGPESLRASTIISVVVPEGVTEIDSAFFEDYYLTSVTLPQSLRVIRQNAFHACSVLASITIPSGVTTIGNYAFFDCSALTSMTVESVAPPSVTGDLFPRDLIPPGLTAIYVPAAGVDAYKNANGWKKHADLITPIGG
jgi:hypothetical protein